MEKTPTLQRREKSVENTIPVLEEHDEEETSTISGSGSGSTGQKAEPGADRDSRKHEHDNGSIGVVDDGVGVGGRTSIFNCLFCWSRRARMLWFGGCCGFFLHYFSEFFEIKNMKI